MSCCDVNALSDEISSRNRTSLHLQQLFTMVSRFYNPYIFHYSFSDDILKAAIDINLMQKSRHIIVKHFNL